MNTPANPVRLCPRPRLPRTERLIDKLRELAAELDVIPKGSITIDFAGDHYTLKVTRLIDGD